MFKMGIKPFRHWNEDSNNNGDSLGLLHRDPEPEERSLGSRILNKDEDDDDD